MRRLPASPNAALCETTISITTRTPGLVHASHTMSEVEAVRTGASHCLVLVCLQLMYNINSLCRSQCRLSCVPLYRIPH